MTHPERETPDQDDVQAYDDMGTLGGFGLNQGPAGIDRQPTDRRIHEEVCTILMDNEQIPIADLDVEVKDGAVTLRGSARDAHTRERAGDLVAMIAGVKQVRNELSVHEARQRGTSRG